MFIVEFYSNIIFTTESNLLYNVSLPLISILLQSTVMTLRNYKRKWCFILQFICCYMNVFMGVRMQRFIITSDDSVHDSVWEKPCFPHVNFFFFYNEEFKNQCYQYYGYLLTVGLILTTSNQTYSAISAACI